MNNKIRFLIILSIGLIIIAVMPQRSSAIKLENIAVLVRERPTLMSESEFENIIIQLSKCGIGCNKEIILCREETTEKMLVEIVKEKNWDTPEIVFIATFFEGFVIRNRVLIRAEKEDIRTHYKAMIEAWVEVSEELREILKEGETEKIHSLLDKKKGGATL